MSPPNEKVLYVLTGPTAVGKSELSLAWAERNQAEIISCDSLLFYRGMDIGTAKPTRAELARVPHHLIDVCEVTERMDITGYVEAVRRTLVDLAARGRRVLVVGGSGFYLRAFFSPVADEVAVAPELRAELEERLRTRGLPALVNDLVSLDPASIQAIDTSNPRRVLRALERCRTTGRSLAELAADFARQPRPFAEWEPQLTRLDRPPEELDQRIAQRVEAMLRSGLVEEVRRLIDAGLKTNPSAARAIGYRETIDLLEGRLTEAELPAAIIQNTRALVKKQRTWFRTQVPAHRVVNPDTSGVGDLFESIG